MDGKTPAFVSLHKLLNSLFRELYSAGIGATRRRSETLSERHEEKLWSSGVLGVDNPQCFLNSVFFLITD